MGNHAEQFRLRHLPNIYFLVFLVLAGRLFGCKAASYEEAAPASAQRSAGMEYTAGESENLAESATAPANLP